MPADLTNQDTVFGPSCCEAGGEKGKESTQRLTGEFASMVLRVLPLHDEHDDTQIVGCISILNSVGE